MKILLILLIMGLLSVAIVIYFLWPEKDKIFQTIPIVILVFVTCYYAIETKKLVDEERRKRIADYNEKRIAEFYAKATELLTKISGELSNDKLDENQLMILFPEAYNFLIRKKYMVSDITSKRLLKIIGLLSNVIDKISEHKDVKDIKIDLKHESDELHVLLLKEMKDIEKRIRDIYEY